jgi:CheY-like chemotaxis protein
MLISIRQNTTSDKRSLPMNETRCPPRSTAGKTGVPESALLKRAERADFQITIVAESLGGDRLPRCRMARLSALSHWYSQGLAGLITPAKTVGFGPSGIGSEEPSLSKSGRVPKIGAAMSDFVEHSCSTADQMANANRILTDQIEQQRRMTDLLEQQARLLNPETCEQQIEVFLGGKRLQPRAHVSHSFPAVPRAVRKHARVLFVDSLSTNLELARSILELFGYKVVTAPRVADALDQASLHLTDLILSDASMSQSGGYDFVRAVKASASLASLPFVFIVSTMLEDDRASRLAFGAARFLIRPTDVEEMLEEIEACLQETKSRGENSDR